MLQSNENEVAKLNVNFLGGRLQILKLDAHCNQPLLTFQIMNKAWFLIWTV